MYSVTKNICAAIHHGRIEPQVVIDRLEDRHRAKLPELGVDTTVLLTEAKLARIRNYIFALALLIPTFWIVYILSDFYLVELGAYTPEEYVIRFVSPLLLVAVIGLFKTIVVNHHLRQKLVVYEESCEIPSSNNVVVFGGFSPFAGYGLDLDGWSFTIDAKKPKEIGTPTFSFGQVELLDHVSKALHKNIMRGTIDDKLFVNGRRIRNNKIFLQNIKASPTTSVDASVVAERIGFPDQDARHYRTVSVPIADGQVFLTYFLRSTMLGDSLFIESRCFILPPIKQEFSDLVHLPTWRGFRYYVRVFVSKLIASPISWLAGPIQAVVLLGRAQTAIAHALFGHPEDKLKVQDETYNYGNVGSLRESFSVNTFHTYFQMLDKDMTVKTCQHVIVNSIVDFLDAHGIDTGDIKERRTQIFNSGVIVSGGTVTAQQLAVGSGASVASRISNAISRNKESKEKA